MAVNITDLKFQDQYTGIAFGGLDTGANDFIGCVGDLLIATIQFEIAWQQTGTLSFDSTNDTITITTFGNSWAGNGFQAGDSIAVVGSTSNDGTYTINSIDGLTISVTGLIADESTACTVYGTTPVTALDFYYNEIGTNYPQNFVSLTDNVSIQRFTSEVPIADVGSALMPPNATSYAWWDYDVNSGTQMMPTLYPMGIGANYEQLFKIEFPFFVKPFSDVNVNVLLSNAYKQNVGSTSILNSFNFIQPNYFLNQCLGFLFQIDAKYALTHSVPDHTSNPVFKKGNTAWFDQFFPTGINFLSNLLVTPQYEFKSIAYSVSSSSVPSIQTDKVTDVTIELTNKSGNWTADDLFVVHFAWLPTNAGDYLGYSDNNQQNFRTVFLYDRCKTSVTAAAANGDMYGTNIQALYRVQSTFVTNTLTITFKIDFGSLSQTMMELNPLYMIWVTPQNQSVTQITESNRTAVLCDVNSAFIDTDDATLLNFYTTTDDVVFYSEGTASTIKSDYVGLLGEYGYATGRFKVKQNCIVKKINISIVAQSSLIYDPTQYEFPLEEWNHNTEEYYNGKINEINIEQIAGFDLPNNSLYNQRFILRKSDDDGGGYYAYRFGYGFQSGFQFWENKEDLPIQYTFYHNNYYPMYTQGRVESGAYLLGDYSTAAKFKMYFEIYDKSTGITTEFIHYADMNFYDSFINFSDLSAQDYAGTNYTMDENGNDLGGGVLVDQKTGINAFFESTTSTNPIGTGYAKIDMIVYYDNGKEMVWDKISNTDTSIPTGSVWQNIPIISTYTYEVSAFAFLDFSTFEVKPKYIRLYSKIYY